MVRYGVVRYGVVWFGVLYWYSIVNYIYYTIVVYFNIPSVSTHEQRTEVVRQERYAGYIPSWLHTNPDPN